MENALSALPFEKGSPEGNFGVAKPQSYRSGWKPGSKLAGLPKERGFSALSMNPPSQRWVIHRTSSRGRATDDPLDGPKDREATAIKGNAGSVDCPPPRVNSQGRSGVVLQFDGGVGVKVDSGPVAFL